MVAPNDTTNPLRLVREPECKTLTGLSRQRRWELARENKFPKPVRVSERAKAWRYGDLEAWLRSRTERSPSEGAAA